MIAAIILFATSLIPFHGTVVAPVQNGAVIRNDDITNTLPVQTQRYTLDPRVRVSAGTGIEGLLDRSTTPWTLRDAFIAGAFVPGLPDAAHVQIVDIGKSLPHATLVDQNGNLLDLQNAYTGKTVLLSFVFTRCPDKNLCPAISGKYAYMQSRLDPAHFALVEISLDPPYDSPAVLRDYAKAYGANPAIWHLLTGTASTTQRVLDQFGINSLRVSSANFIHNDKLFIITPTGKIAYIVDTAGWDPQGVIAEASSVAGMASNPLERFKLSLIASVVALCGGSAMAGVVLLEIGLFFVVLAAVLAGLLWAGRVLWHR